LNEPEKLAFATRMSHVGRAGTHSYGFVNPPVLRGSTTLYRSVQHMEEVDPQRLEQVQTYGILGGTTHHALEDAVAEIEGGTRCQIVSSGLAAVTTVLLALLSAGDHVLLPDSAYGPTRRFADQVLARMGIAVTYYAPMVDEAGLVALMRPQTRLVFAESPGSLTFEVQDVPALARAAHAGGALLALDNTWGLHAFRPFAHGVDVSIQALTKYAGGHSDLLLGAITTADPDCWQKIRDTVLAIGQYASPDDCWLALRGLRTLPVRLARQMRSGLEVAQFMAAQPEVLRVLHPALPGSPGHAIWRRDFSGAASLFGVVFRAEIPPAAVAAMIDSLQLFGIGASWGGYESLALLISGLTRTAGGADPGGPLCRLHVGLEEPSDLIADLAQGLEVLRRQRETT
jgi:cystathionine beta-lyase